MGDACLHEDIGSQPKKEEFTILVTGYAPFRANYPVNPSWEIARGMPNYLPPLSGKDSKDGSVDEAIADMPRVRILVHPEAIHVTYKHVRALVPTFWDGEYQGQKIDACIHIGMAGAYSPYLLERLAHRTGYLKADVSGEFLEDEKQGGHGEDWIWHGLPDELESAYDIPNVYLRWKELSSPDVNVRISEDPGRYLCDFIYYSSLAHLYKQQRPGKACFFHVPAIASDAAIIRGREICVNLIRSIAESEIAERRRAAK
ncbi:hypothetical protein PWT90_08330 [Aphanocladium album]|nr:hypothetical protein PWT90_08330 [Aphanocladium album]